MEIRAGAEAEFECGERFYFIRECDLLLWYCSRYETKRIRTRLPLIGLERDYCVCRTLTYRFSISTLEDILRDAHW